MFIHFIKKESIFQDHEDLHLSTDRITIFDGASPNMENSIVEVVLESDCVGFVKSYTQVTKFNQIKDDW